MTLDELPRIDFATADPTTIIDSMKSLIETELGRILQPADPIVLFLRALSAIIIQQRLIIDQTGKMNLLAYSAGDYLDHLGILVGCERIQATTASVTMEITLSTPRNTVTIVPAGTRFTAGDSIYFALSNDVYFPIGEVEETGKATCLTVGTIGNGYGVNTITEVVDPQPYLQSARNITESSGGSDTESDDSYRERIRQAPEKFSNAGSRGAYEYFTKQASSLISDVCITSPSPGVVRIQPLLTAGELPTQEILDLVANSLNDRSVRPLTDKIEVISPEIVYFDIDLTYYINRSKIAIATTIQNQVATAIQNYISWQCSKLGRDIEPLELGYQLRLAGAKRIEMNSPVFTSTREYQVAKTRSVNVIFGGIEED